MRKISPVFILVFGLFSCEKDWICNCNVGDLYVDYPVKNETKKDAVEDCQEQQDELSVNVANSTCQLQ
jgi:hypothetical protein